MTSHYDMSTLDSEHRMIVYVVVDELDPIGISIHDDSTITEIRETIANRLNIPISSQETLTCVNNNGEVCNIELTKSDETSNKKLTDYDPPIIGNATINLDVLDSFDIKTIEQKPSKARNAPKKRAPMTPDDSNANSMKPTSIQGERQKQKQMKKQQRQAQRQQPRQQQQQQQHQHQQQTRQQQQQPNNNNMQRYEPTEQELALFHKIQKTSKTHCRLLFVLMEIQLILLIVNWGGLDMVMYLIAIAFALAGFRGCRKLHPLWILAFLLWLLLEILLITLFIIAGLVESHESIYGSTAAYIGLLSFELLLDITWAWFYFQFLRMVLSMGFRLRAWGEINMKSTVIFC